MMTTTTIDAHIIDARGVYLETSEIDPMGPQPAGAVYEELPAELEGYTRIWTNGQWVHVDDTEVPDMPRPTPIVPASVSRAQGKTALINAGLWPAVLAAVDAIEDATQRALAEVALHDTTTWERMSPTLNALAFGLGMNDAQLDALFVSASQVVL